MTSHVTVPDDNLNREALFRRSRGCQISLRNLLDALDGLVPEVDSTREGESARAEDAYPHRQDCHAR